jgi:hypothetical protein
MSGGDLDFVRPRPNEILLVKNLDPAVFALPTLLEDTALSGRLACRLNSGEDRADATGDNDIEDIDRSGTFSSFSSKSSGLV